MVFFYLLYIEMISAPCSELICENTTDTCNNGKCQCGDHPDFVCTQDSQISMCSEGQCVCSKIKGLFQKGDGSTQGSCNSRSHKCQSNGVCAECITSAECSGLTDTCIGFKCSCGTGGPCNSTRSNICTDGSCMCGKSLACSQKQEMVLLSHMYGNNLVANCDQTKCQGTTNAKGYCGCHWNGSACMVPRSDQEVCTQVTEFYNPLFIKGKLKYFDQEALLCDDIIGSQIGEYHCLGIIILHYNFV